MLAINDVVLEVDRLAGNGESYKGDKVMYKHMESSLGPGSTLRPLSFLGRCKYPDSSNGDNDDETT